MYHTAFLYRTIPVSPFSYTPVASPLSKNAKAKRKLRLLLHVGVLGLNIMILAWGTDPWPKKQADVIAIGRRRRRRKNQKKKTKKPTCFFNPISDTDKWDNTVDTRHTNTNCLMSALFKSGNRVHRYNAHTSYPCRSIFNTLNQL